MSIKKFSIIMSCVTLLLALLVAGSCAPGNGNLRISVQNTDGSPIIGAKVVSERQPEGQLKITGITSKESAGTVSFNDIKPGSYQIQVSRYGYAPETIEVTISAGKTTSVAVKLFFASPPPIT